MALKIESLARRDKQVGFKLKSELFAKLSSAAVIEKRGPNELARMIFEWAFEKYLEAGSYDRLTGNLPNVSHLRDQVEREGHLFDAKHKPARKPKQDDDD